MGPLANRLLTILILAIVGAGCLQDDSKPSPNGEPSSPSGVPTVADSGTSVPIVQGPGVRDRLNETVSFQKCAGTFGSGEALESSVRPLVPSHFNVSGASTETVTTLLNFLTCERVSHGGSVFEDVLLFQTMVLVRPVNDTWNEDGLEWYVLELISNKLDLPGLPDANGEIVLENVAAQERWTAKYGGATVETEVHKTGSGTAYTWVANQWYDTFRVDVLADYEYDSVNPGLTTLRSTGPSNTFTALGPAHAMTTNVLATEDMVWFITSDGQL